MKEESNNEIRCKLHITTSHDTQVKNSWMCLNYNQKPTISHIIDHIKRNYFLNELGNEEKEKASLASSIKLYLEDYWLPPYENSRLIRENDCIKVDIKLEKCNLNLNDENNNLFTDTIKPKAENYSYLNYNATTASSNTSNSSTESKFKDVSSKYMYTLNNKTASNKNDQPEFMTSYANSSNQYQSNLDCYNYLDYNKNIDDYEQLNYKSNKNEFIKKSSSNLDEKPQVESKKPVKSSENNAAKKTEPKPTNKSIKQEIKCHKKFSIGSYVHMLNEPVEPERDTKKKTVISNKKKYLEEDSDGLSEEQIIDDYYQSLKHKDQLKLKNENKNKKETQQQQSNKQIISENTDLDKIAAKINSSGQQKWKNSTMPARSTGPKHIIFSSSDSSSSSSDSSDSEDEKSNKKSKPTVTTTQSTKNETKPQEENKPNEKKKVFYEQTKEEQLNSVSYNESYLAVNPKNLNDFKVKFDQKKLNAPPAEEFSESQVEKNISESSDDSFSSSNTSTNNDSDTKQKSGGKRRNRRSRSPKIDYDNLQPLVGQPRLDDKLAFQILEISSNFTPELSGFKNGTVVEFNSNTNEVTLRLHSKYNTILKKPNKFNVVFDEADGEIQSLKNNENFLNNEPIDDENSNDSASQSEKSKKYEDEILKVDYRNLMNVKLMPKVPSLENKDCQQNSQ